MVKVKKKKVRIKYKNIIIFIILCASIITLLIKGTTIVINMIKSPNQNKKEIHTKKKSLTKEEIKLNKLDNIQNKIDYFNIDYIDRYIKYKKKNENLSNEQIIKNVNMHLDLEHYKNTAKAKNLNSKVTLVNKHYFLAEDFEPDNLEKISSQYALSNMKLVNYAKEAFEDMASDAKDEDLTIIAMSTYRSYEYQIDLYNRYAKNDGKDAADTYSGRPGHSEHQTGLAVDVYNKEENYTDFEKTEEYKWMKKNAHKYGFILRFPKNKEKETGYHFESWHYRYVGKKAAKYIKENKLSLEEYYATKIKNW